jgi:hypothetical protein
MELRRLKLEVALWPGYDSYDLRITFADGTVWAVDVKDWAAPHLLAKRLEPLPRDGSLDYDRAFYAIPDARMRETPDYLTRLQNATMRAGAPREFEIVTLSALVNLAQRAREDHQ